MSLLPSRVSSPPRAFWCLLATLPPSPSLTLVSHARSIGLSRSSPPSRTLRRAPLVGVLPRQRRGGRAGPQDGPAGDRRGGRGVGAAAVRPPGHAEQHLPHQPLELRLRVGQGLRTRRRGAAADQRGRGRRAGHERATDAPPPRPPPPVASTPPETRRRAPSAVAERSHSSRSDDRLARARAVADRHNETKLCVRCAAVRGALPLLHARARGAARGARRRPVFVASLSRTRATSTATVCSTSSRSSRR